MLKAHAPGSSSELRLKNQVQDCSSKLLFKALGKSFNLKRFSFKVSYSELKIKAETQGLTITLQFKAEDQGLNAMLQSKVLHQG